MNIVFLCFCSVFPNILGAGSSWLVSSVLAHDLCLFHVWLVFVFTKMVSYLTEDIFYSCVLLWYWDPDVSSVT